MLKVRMNKTETENRWTLHGQLTGPSVSDLRTVGRNTQGAGAHRRCVFDLNEVTCVDKAGEKRLPALAKEGVQSDVGGAYIRGVLSPVEGTNNGGS